MIDITLARNPHGRMTTTQDVADAIVTLQRDRFRLDQRQHHLGRRRRVRHRLTPTRPSGGDPMTDAVDRLAPPVARARPARAGPRLVRRDRRPPDQLPGRANAGRASGPRSPTPTSSSRDWSGALRVDAVEVADRRAARVRDVARRRPRQRRSRRADGGRGRGREHRRSQRPVRRGVVPRPRRSRSPARSSGSTARSAIRRVAAVRAAGARLDRARRAARRRRRVRGGRQPRRRALRRRSAARSATGPAAGAPSDEERGRRPGCASPSSRPARTSSSSTCRSRPRRAGSSTPRSSPSCPAGRSSSTRRAAASSTTSPCSARVETGSLRGAAIDVFEREPLPPDSPLRRSDRILLSSHAAATTASRWPGSSRSSPTTSAGRSRASRSGAWSTGSGRSSARRSPRRRGRARMTRSPLPSGRRTYGSPRDLRWTPRPHPRARHCTRRHFAADIGAPSAARETGTE